MTGPKTATNDVNVRFLGAVRGIGGSMLAVESGDKRILLDCGRPMRGSRTEFPVEPASVDAVVVSHAHQDHAGWLVDFFAGGFAGPVLMSPATRAIVEVQIGESYRRRHDDARVAAVLAKAGPAPIRLQFMFDRLIATPFGNAFVLPGDAVVTLLPAGHLLGAASVLLHWHGRALFFTGDLGRSDSPLYPNPTAAPVADLIISESTYGDREAEPFLESETRLGELAQQTSTDGGRLIIPAFRLGRIQLVLTAIARLRERGEWPDLPIFVDSPTAQAFATIHEEFRDELRDPNVVEGWRDVAYVETDYDSASLALEKEPGVVLVAGGMADSIRAKRHLKAHVDDPRCRIALVSFQARATMGRD